MLRSIKVTTVTVDELKVIAHGMYTSNGTSMSYLQLAGAAATFIKDTVTTL